MPIPVTSPSKVLVLELCGHPAQYQGVLVATGGRLFPKETALTFGRSFSLVLGAIFFKRQSAIISLDSSDTLGINVSFVTASNFPDKRGLSLMLKRIWATCSSTIAPFSSIIKICSNPSQN